MNIYLKLCFSASSVSKPSAMDSESYQRMSSTDVYDEIPEVKEEYDLAPDFQRIYIAGQEISGVNTCNILQSIYKMEIHVLGRFKSD